MTGTNAGLVLMASYDIRSEFGLEERVAKEERTLSQCFDLLHRRWLLFKGSSESMMRGTANESALMSALLLISFFKHVFEVGLFCTKYVSYLACLPDGIAILDRFHFFRRSQNEKKNNEGEDLLGCVEIKARVVAATLA